MTSAHAAARPATMLVAGAVPLAAARLVPLDGTEVDGPGLVCPFREATGVPCPLCGATRAIALASRGDSRFLDFGAVWVFVVAVVALAGAAGLVAAAVRRLRRRDSARPATWRLGWRRIALGAAGMVVVAWAWALAHQDAIVEG